MTNYRITFIETKMIHGVKFYGIYNSHLVLIRSTEYSARS